ncbi:MAG TPA: hypothetical protein PLE45_01665 [Spirochaetota bacterium]|nr:hypothetical protein [Spirochaetota bacterium]HPP03758.1 hypothetical protein [Spirochaetota bacterium]
MSDQKILQLQKETGCDTVLAKLILKFTGDDLDGAIKILKSVDKDIFVIRGKFIAQTVKIYGSFIIFYNSKTKIVDKTVIIAKSEDKSAIEFDFEKNWSIFLQGLNDYQKKNATDIDIQSKFINAIASSPKIVSSFDRILNKKEIDYEELKSFFEEIFIGITGDINIALKLKVDKSDAFEVNKGNISENDIVFKDEKKEDNKNDQKKSTFDQNQILLLKIDLDLSPIDGKLLSELQPGELIGVKIVDDRPIAHYIASLLSGNTFDFEENKIVFAELKDIKLTEGGILVRVEFGPGIYGEAYYGEDVKVRVASLDNEKDEKEAKKDNFIFKNIWIIGGILIAIIIILLFIFTQQ